MNAPNEHYTVVARRFRPQSFDDVVGQERVARALKNALRSGRVAHAYLFTGVRGVGKTSMARILAKALNCPHATDGEPCNQCEICRNIAAGHDVDVLEIDGASNRGIDDVRSLRANVSVRSMRSRHKVYIIDEVHMLTKEAFNALLKTLEEPPPGVKFIFCTTEPTKVPETILSRCQRFDFGTIATSRIAERLGAIAGAEGVGIDDAALEALARRAGGSMRDAQSLLDQLLAFCEDRITADDVRRLLGTASDERLLAIAEAAVEHRPAQVLQEFAAALDEGAELGELADQLVHLVRDMMIVASKAQGVPLLAVSQSRREQLAGLADGWGLETILAALQVLSEARSRMARSTFPRAIAEAALVRMALLDRLDDLRALLTRLESGEAAPSGGTTGPRPRTPRSAAGRSHPTAGGDEDEPAAVEPVSEQRRIDLQPGRERELLSELVACTDDMLKTHLLAAETLAISGPNRIALSFPKSYHFAKQYCERPDVRSRIERLVKQITQRDLRVECVLAETGGPPKVGENRRPASARRSSERTGGPIRGPITDPYVQEAINQFGATVVRRDRLSDGNSSEG